MRGAAHQTMDLWNKQDWIKDILSKSGTEIKQVPAEDLRKMVYYTGLPLLMQQAENNAASQLCFNNATSERGSEQSQQQQQHQQQQSAQLQQQRQQRVQYQHQQQVVNLSNGGDPTQQLLPSSAQVDGSGGSPPLPTGYGGYQSIPSNMISQQQPVVSAKFRCEQCNINFGSKSAHTSHMKSHSKQQQQQSGMADGKVTSTKTVNAAATPSDPYQCDVCKKTFAVPARLVRHYRTHTGERPFECEFCHKMFSVKENLQVHRRIHTKERPYKCDICGRAFEHSGKLHRHMRIHTGERPHKCNVCGKTFIQSGQLVIHMRTHTGEKPYKCPVEGCGKGFTCSKQLKVHSRTHTGEKPYHCDICFRDFGYNHVLKLHRVQHYGSKCYKCTICDETFKSKKEMEAHIKGHANEIPDEEETDSKAGVTLSSSAGSIRSSLDYSSSSSNIATPDSLSTEEPMALEEDLPTTRIEFGDQGGSSRPNDGVHYYSQFEQSVLRSYGVQSGVNPALLAAASIAAAATVSGLESNEGESEHRTPSPPPLSYPESPQHMSIAGRLTPPSSQPQPVDMIVHQQSPLQHPSHQHQQHSPINANAFMYEPLSIMKHHGYFAPASQVTQFRSSSDIVRQVEAAIAGTENLLTPPRSSPESPDRSSSPDSDSVLMADRDNNTLPPRKRKLYFKDQQPPQHHPHQGAMDLHQHQRQASPVLVPMGDRSSSSSSSSGSSTPPSPPVMRMSSVIQYAKAS